MRSQLQTKTTPKPSFTPVKSGWLQRKCACGNSASLTGKCSECENKRLTLQRRSSNQAEPDEVPPIVHEVLRSPGQPLNQDTRTFMESRFSHDFSQVRVHTDAKAAESARAVNALAYTVERHIVFGAEQYIPQTIKGQRLLAHELTHVVQQTFSQGNLQPFLYIQDPDSAAERQAEQMAEDITNQNQPSLVQQQQKNGNTFEHHRQWRSHSIQMLQRQIDSQPDQEPQEIEAGREDEWTRRVDRAVRAHFALSGPRLTGSRVRFLNQAEFARQFPTSQLPELLLNLFYSPPAGSIIHNILRHHHRGLAGIQRLRQFITERINIGYFEYQLVSPGNTTIQRITPTELVSQYTAGFANITPTSRSRRTVFIQTPGAVVETLVHETCHFYVHNNFRNFALSTQNTDRIVFGLRLSQILLEGFAEYFARQVMEANQPIFGTLGFEAYQSEFNVVTRLVATIGEQEARDAYFRGNRAALSRLEQAITVNEQLNPNLELLVPDFMLP